MVPRAALEQYVAQRRLASLAIAGARRAWKRMRGRRWESAWRDDVGPQVAAVVAAGQEAAASRSAQYMTEVLDELGLDSTSPTELVPSALSGVAGDGRSADSLTYGAVITAAKAQYGSDVADLTQREAEAAALAEAEDYLEAMVADLMAEAARAAETVAFEQREWLTGYVRMIEPGACSRCAVLAGRFYLFNEGFLRHPRCRCVHIPASETLLDDPRTNPNAYFDSLSKAEQDRIFTTAGADAVRAGADISQVVNARRGMSTAQQNPRGWIPRGRLDAVTMFGRDVFVTTEGVTKRGVYGKVRGKKPVRLMPESIVALATDRADLIRLLKVYGYIA